MGQVPMPSQRYGSLIRSRMTSIGDHICPGSSIEHHSYLFDPYAEQPHLCGSEIGMGATHRIPSASISPVPFDGSHSGSDDRLPPPFIDVVAEILHFQVDFVFRHVPPIRARLPVSPVVPVIPPSSDLTVLLERAPYGIDANGSLQRSSVKFGERTARPVGPCPMPEQLEQREAIWECLMSVVEHTDTNDQIAQLRTLAPALAPVDLRKGACPRFSVKDPIE